MSIGLKPSKTVNRTLTLLCDGCRTTTVHLVVAAVIAEGRDVTYDMKPNRDDPTAVGTSQMADAIIDAM
jgi:hypothetical protein